MVFEFGSGSGKTERGPLIVPRRAADVSVRAASLPSDRGAAPIENRVGDIRREIAEADKTSEIGRAHTVALGKRSKGNVVRRVGYVNECVKSQS